MSKPSNTKRAARAKEMLKSYCDTVYAGRYGDVPDEDSIPDLLADLHHHLSASGDENPISTMKEMLEVAISSFEEEIT